MEAKSVGSSLEGSDNQDEPEPPHISDLTYLERDPPALPVQPSRPAIVTACERVDVDPASLRWYASQDDPDDEGDSCNRSYRSLVGYGWEDVRAALAAEAEWMLRFLGGESEQSLRDELDARLDNDASPEPSDSDYDLATLYELDLGVAAAALALAATGSVPLYSCNGQPGHSDDHPLVLFRSDRSRVGTLIPVALAAKCGLVNATNGRLLLYCRELAHLTDFARQALQTLGDTTQRP